MLETCGGHQYHRVPGVRMKEGATIFCVYKCGCWKDSRGFGGPEGVNPQGECPNAPKGNRLQQLLAQPQVHL